MVGLSVPQTKNISTQSPGLKLYLRRAQDIKYGSMTFSSKACFHSNGEADLSVVPEIFKIRFVKQKKTPTSNTKPAKLY